MDIANCASLSFVSYTAVQGFATQLDMEDHVNPAAERKPTASAISHTNYRQTWSRTCSMRRNKLPQSRELP